MDPRAARVALRTAAEVAGELAVDIDRQAAVDAARREFVGRAHEVDECLDKRRFVLAQ